MLPDFARARSPRLSVAVALAGLAALAMCRHTRVSTQLDAIRESRATPARGTTLAIARAMKRIALLAAFLSVSAPRTARPCDWPNTSVYRHHSVVTAGIDSIAGPNVLFISESASTRLADTDADPPVDVPLDPITPAGLDGALGAHDEPLVFLRARQPLSGGFHTFGEQEFQLGPEMPAPDLGGSGQLSMTLEGAAFVSDTHQTPGEPVPPNLRISIPASTLTPGRAANYLVVLRGPGGVELRRLVRETEQERELNFYCAFPELGQIGSVALCATVTGVSESGELGAPLDLGCIDPADESDPRVVRAPPQGCSTTGSPGGVPLFGLLAVALGLVRVLNRAHGRRQDQDQQSK